ncbi:hypothetical protein O3M35_000742 [Rhynocoris fuscipes]|uniref:Pyruvate kinase n=1 Tax=Rhynocoris fuscipes TaxID=488301 RepID=A0AAW1DPJ1_9HEMI
MSAKPISIMPWHKPEPFKPLKMQDQAAYKDRLLEHNAALNVDSPVSPLNLSSIMCTISDMCCEQHIVGEMIANGMRVARFSMCGMKPSEQGMLIKRFRSYVMEHSKIIERTCTISIAVELKGAAVLIGKFADNLEKIHILSGDVLILTTNRGFDDRGTKEKIYVDYDELSAILRPKDKVLLEFGRIELIVRGVVDSDIVCDVIEGGDLTPLSEVTVIGVPLNIGPITEKDLEDVNFALDNQVDLIIVPMVRTVRTIEAFREILGERCQTIALFAKIESRQAYDNFNDILRVSDGVVINRGRLSIELSSEKVMQVQKSMIARANKAGKPAFVVTEYLNSMIHKCYPTFAEITDVINAIVEGADGIILEEETASGDFPTITVRTLAQLCKEGEAQIWQTDIFNTLSYLASPPIDPAHAVCISAVEAAFKLHATGIFIVTVSGKSAKLMARYKPRCPIFAMTRYGAIARQLNLYKGILPVHIITPPHPCWAKDVDLRMQDGIDIGKSMNIIKPGDALILVNCWRPGAGFTNNIRIVYASVDQPWVLPQPADQEEEI